jgi:hypothetical protein
VVGQDAAPVMTGGPDCDAAGEEPHVTESNGTSATHIATSRRGIAPREDLVTPVTSWSMSEEREQSMTSPLNASWFGVRSITSDPEGRLAPDIRARLIASARNAYFTKLAFACAQ